MPCWDLNNFLRHRDPYPLTRQGNQSLHEIPLVITRTFEYNNITPGEFVLVKAASLREHDITSEEAIGGGEGGVHRIALCGDYGQVAIRNGETNYGPRR